MSWEIVTAAEVASVSGMPVASFDDLWYDIVADMLETERGYRYLGTTSVISDEAHDGSGKDILRVKYPPIVSVSSLSIDSSSVGTTSYKTYNHYIRLVSTIDDTAKSYFPVGVQNVSISYTSGLAVPPGDVRLTMINAITVIAQFMMRGASVANTKYSVPGRGTESNPAVPSVFLVNVVKSIIRGALMRKVRFD